MKNRQTMLPLVAAIMAAFAPMMVQAADDAVQSNEGQTLQNVQVRGKRVATNITERVTREVLDTQMVRSNSDLVRYSPDVGIADQGRHSKGFSIRGLEDNRVGMSIDGVALPDSEENSLYKRYGNLNTSRQNIDPELARTIEVVKGADSFNQGSGNLGGGVNYRTLQSSDIIRGTNKFGALLRSGYGSRNNEWAHTVGTAYRGEQADLVLLYSHRRGHQMESAGGFTIPDDGSNARYLGYSRQIPEESKHSQNSYLAKYSWQFNDAHRAGISWNAQRRTNDIVEDAALTLNSYWRTARDLSERHTSNVFYEYMPESKWLALLRLEADYQKTETSAVNKEGRRADRWNPVATPSDDDIRIFTTEFKRLGFRLDTQRLMLGNTSHTFTLRGGLSNRRFDVLHNDRVYLTWGSNRGWQPWEQSTMMHPIETRQHFISLQDQMTFNKIWSATAGIRYDYGKHVQQDLSVPCRNCVRTDSSRFKQFSWNLGVNAQFHPNWNVGYQISTGFRLPSASEMYFDYRDNAAGAWLNNPNLKTERSFSQALQLQGNGSYGKLAVNLHHMRYQDFLYEQETWGEFTSYGRTIYRPVQQMQNIDTAKVYGLEFSGTLNLHRLLPVSEGWKLFGALGYSRGNLSNGADLLSIQPMKAIIGLDYEHPEGKWGIFSRLTYTAAKKPEDAQYQTTQERCTREEPDPWYPFWSSTPTRCAQYAYDTPLATWKHLSEKAVVFDVYGFYKPSENWTVRAGVYNVFNRKYHTWDVMRGLNNTGGIVNSVGLRENRRYGGYPGLQRYYAPARNFAVSVEYKF